MKKKMNTNRIIGLAACLLITLILVAFVAQEKKVTKHIAGTGGKGFAVLELFTSEGCSSCPPADELMATIQKESQGQPIYILAYHVDYWNNQGWKDIFSSPEYSQRQVQYVQWLGSPQIYTPQLIINGTEQYVGSDESNIRGAIHDQLTDGSVSMLTLKAHQDNKGLSVQYQVGNVVKGSSLLIAIVQKAAQSKVERGENAGHTLLHVQIVRALKNEAIRASGSGNMTVSLPKGFDEQGWEVIGLIQDQGSGQILGVTKAELSK